MAKKKQTAPKKSKGSQVKSQSTSPSREGRSANWKKPALYLLLITALCYLPSLSNGLVNWDDDVNITDNPNLQRLDSESFANIFDLDKGAVIGNYNPLPILTFAIEKAIAGDFNTTLIHGTNLLLHLLTVFFAFRVLMALSLGPWASFIGGLLFGIHPMRVESVAWATERKDVLFAVFFFAALMYYIRWVQAEGKTGRSKTYVTIIILAVLSLFSKVQAVTLPLAMLTIDYLLRRPLKFKLIWEKLPFWGLSLVFGLINIYTLGKQGSTTDDVTNFDMVDRLCIGAYSFCVYIYKLFIPYPMSPLYPYPKPLPTLVYLAPIGFAAAIYLVYRWWKNDQRWLVFGTLFFFFNVMFLLQVFGAGQGFLADRFTYVPYFGFFAIAAWMYDRVSQDEAKRSTLQLVSGVVFALFAIMTFFQIKVWKNGETLWTHVIKFEKETNSLPYWNRGQYYRDNGNYQASLSDYSQAIKINPKNAELHNSRGKTHFDMAMLEQYKSQSASLVQKALEDYASGLDIPNAKDKTRSELFINKGAAHASLNQYDQAIASLSEGLKIDPNNKNGYFNRSLVYFNLRKFKEAIEDYTSYLKFDPYNVNVWYERGMIRRTIGENEAAVQDLSKALELDPQFGIAYLERARAYAQMGNKGQAQQDYQRAAQFQYPMSDYDRQLLNK